MKTKWHNKCAQCSAGQSGPLPGVIFLFDTAVCGNDESFYNFHNIETTTWKVTELANVLQVRLK